MTLGELFRIKCFNSDKSQIPVQLSLIWQPRRIKRTHTRKHKMRRYHHQWSLLFKTIPLPRIIVVIQPVSEFLHAYQLDRNRQKNRLANISARAKKCVQKHHVTRSCKKKKNTEMIWNDLIFRNFPSCSLCKCTFLNNAMMIYLLIYCSAPYVQTVNYLGFIKRQRLTIIIILCFNCNILYYI